MSDEWRKLSDKKYASKQGLKVQYFLNLLFWEKGRPKEWFQKNKNKKVKSKKKISHLIVELV